MSDASDAVPEFRGPIPDDALRLADKNAPVLAADGTPLKKSLNRALRLSKLRALA